MVFGNQNTKLQDELFCATEERNYFQAKYLEQVSEIQHLKSQLDRSRKEIQRLRQQVLESSFQNDLCIEEEKKDDGISSVSSPLPPPQISRNMLESGRAVVATTATTTSTTLPADAAILEKSSTDASQEDLDDDDYTDEQEQEEAFSRDHSVAARKESWYEQGDGEEEEEEEDEDEDIRKNAAKLLQWADYRSSTFASPTGGRSVRDDDESLPSRSSSKGSFYS